MEIRPGKSKPPKPGESRGSGPGTRKRRSDALEPRKDVIFRLPEELARQLKIIAAIEGTTVQDFCEDVVVSKIEQVMKKHGLKAEQISR